MIKQDLNGTILRRNVGSTYVLLFFYSSLPMVMASAIGLVFGRRSHWVRSRSCWSCPASFMSGTPILLVWVFRGSVDATLSIGCLAVGSSTTTRLLMPAVLTTIQLFRTPLPLGMHAVTGSGGMVWVSPALLMFFLSNQAKQFTVRWADLTNFFETPLKTF